jgi:hypothetical protein
VKIYRRASTDNEGRTSELVDEVELSKAAKPWTDEFSTTANISREHLFRRSDIDMLLNEADVIALHASLLTGMQRKIEELRDEVTTHKKTADRLKLQSIRIQLVLEKESRTDTEKLSDVRAILKGLKP